MGYYLAVVWEAFLPHQPHYNGLARSRKTSLTVFYASAFVCAGCISFAGKLHPSVRKLLLALAIAGAASAVWCLLRFLRGNDEREQQINFHALSFAFTGTLILSLVIGFLQTVGFHSVSWLGIPAFMVILWSLGLILFSWRYR